MPDTQPIRVPSSSQRVQSPPRRQPKPADPCAMVIFGAGGDLTKRLVVPALYNLAHSKVLPEKFALIGVGHGDGTTEQWRDNLFAMLKSFVGNTSAEFDVANIDEAAWKRLADQMTYIPGDFTKPEIYGRIRDTLAEAEKAHGTAGNAIFYLAVADHFFGTVVDQLGKAKLTEQGKPDAGGKPSFWRRVVIEKPFGHDLPSARELNAASCARCTRTRSTASTISSARRRCRTSWRSASPTACSSRSGTATASITCRSPPPRRSASRTRGGFYEPTGALRDMVPNHVFSCCRWSPWSRRPPSTPTRSATRRPRCSPPCSRSSRPKRGARPVRRGQRAGASRRGLSRRAERRARFEHRDLRRDEAARSTTGAGPACRSTSAPAST